MQKLFKLGMFAVVAIGLFGAGTASQAMAQNAATAVFAVQQMQMEIVRGTPGREQAAYDRIAQSLWIFEPATGTFYFYPLDYYQNGLQPFVGNYGVSGNVVSFQAQYQFNAGANATAAAVVGSIDFSSGQPVLQMEFAAASTMAAIINGAKFGHSASSHYLVRGIMQQVQ